MIVAPNDYLDARRPEWLDAEMMGRVRYDARTRTVVVQRAPEIEAALVGHVAATIRAIVIP